MRNIYIMSGIPGCGKSHYCEAHKTERTAVLHRDDFRQHLREKYNTDKYFPCTESEEWREWSNFLYGAIVGAPDWDIYIDQTTITQGSLNKLLDTIGPWVGEKDNIIVIICHTALPICLERNAARTGHALVPEQVIRNMHNAMHDKAITQAKCDVRYPNLNIIVSHTTETEGL